jgi:hypothetical protein
MQAFALDRCDSVRRRVRRVLYWRGKTYCFGNEEVKTEFLKDPDGNFAKAQACYQSKH